MFTINADGSEKLKPLVIRKAFKPCAFGNKTGSQLGFQCQNNAKAWMSTEIYQGWLKEWDLDLQLKTPTQCILLLQDNFSGHVVSYGLKYICVENFTANLTAHVQPNDAGIIRCFKAHYHHHFTPVPLIATNRESHLQIFMPSISLKQCIFPVLHGMQLT